MSWKNKPVGTSVSGVVAREPRTMQSRDYDTDELEFWDSPANTQPKLQMAIYLDLGITHPDPTMYPDHDGVWALYVRQSTQAHKELREVVRKSGAKSIEVGGRLTFTYIGDGEQKNPKFNPPKHFRIEYQPPGNRASADFLSSGSMSYAGQPASTPPAGLDPAAWAALDPGRRAAVLASMQGTSSGPPF